jgi:hypothetical protein
MTIFLGGSCNPTTWRDDIAIPMLEKAGRNYYNPQVKDWRPELVEIEAEAKAKANTLLFVIDRQTRAIASILEATEMICTNRDVVLVIQDIADNTYGIKEGELKDLNRARAYLRDLANRHHLPIHSSVSSAIQRIIDYA